MTENRPCDVNGHPYLLVTEAKKGMKVILDDGFSCVPSDGREVELDEDEDGLYFLCDDGTHYLEGCVSCEGDKAYYDGVYIKADNGHA